MTAKPLPPHGTYARANGSPGRRQPCRCTPCRAEWARRRKQYNVNRQLGRPAEVDARPARQHIGRLRLTMTWAQIADAAQVDARTLQLLGDGRQQVVRRGTLERIKAVPPQIAPSAPGLYLDATGCRRRLQALRAIGYSAQAIADHLKTRQARIQLISSGAQPTVRYVLASRIIVAYRELSKTPAPASCSATLTLRHAAAKGWLGPEWWDEEDLDDPDFVPATQAGPRYVAHVENLRELEAQGYTREQIAARLGVSRDTLQRAIAFYRERFGEAA